MTIPPGEGGRLPKIGLICVDSLRILGLQTLLGHGTRFEVGVLAGTRAADLDGLDLILIDSTGTAFLEPLIHALRRIRPQARLLVLGEERDDTYTESVIGAGAQGYLCHSSSEAELQNAVAVVRDGSIWAPRKVLARLLEQARAAAAQAAPGAPTQPELTRRELQVLRLLVLGRSNREIAEALSIEESTVKSHLARLMRKASVRNRTALTMRAFEACWAF